MFDLRVAVYTAPPVPINNPPSLEGAGGNGLWSPIACTLLYSSTHAVLIDTPITITQNEDLITWIKRIAPGRKLSYIYITHGHGDHFFGIPQLLKEFPEAQPIATAGTIRHMERSIEKEHFNNFWDVVFPTQIQQPFVLAQPLQSNVFKLQDSCEFHVVEVGHSDCADSTVLWVPDLRLAICGDVVYGQVHQMFLEANTSAKREEWIRAIEKVESLDPLYVVPAHSQAGEVFGRWHLSNTKKYIKDFDKAIKSKPENFQQVVRTMKELYPDRFNIDAVILGAQSSIHASQSKA